LVTPFIAKKDTVMATHTCSKRLGNAGLKAEKELIFVRDFCVSSTHRTLKDAATHIGEFLKDLEEILLLYGYF
jgi:hypothetical protein